MGFPAQSGIGYRNVNVVERSQLSPGATVAHPTENVMGARHSTGVPPTASPNLVLAIVCVGIVLANLDLFIVNVALPNIGRDFKDSTLEDLSWILNGYAVVYAALLVFFGRLAERYRRDRSFLLAVALFTAASAACSMANSVESLVVFRVAQAAGAALMTPMPSAFRFPTRETRRGGENLDRYRWSRRGPWSACRRRLGDAQLALDLSGKCPHWHRRLAYGMVEAPEGSGS